MTAPTVVAKAWSSQHARPDYRQEAGATRTATVCPANAAGGSDAKLVDAGTAANENYIPDA